MYISYCEVLVSILRNPKEDVGSSCQRIRSAFTEDNKKGTSYLYPTIPRLIASSDEGPHWKVPTKQNLHQFCNIII
jgi:hypothetical protein